MTYQPSVAGSVYNEGSFTVDSANPIPTNAIISSMVFQYSIQNTTTSVQVFIDLRDVYNSGTYIGNVYVQGNKAGSITIPSAYHRQIMSVPQRLRGFISNFNPQSNAVVSCTMTLTITFTAGSIAGPTTTTPNSSTPGTTVVIGDVSKVLTPTFTAVPTAVPLVPATNYTITIDATKGGLRENRANGFLYLSFTSNKFNNQYVYANQLIKIDGVLSTEYANRITLTEGRASVVVQLPATIPTGRGYFTSLGTSLLDGYTIDVGNTASFVLGTGFDPSGGTVPVIPTALKFSAQPSSSVTLGQAFTCSVTITDGAGTTVAGFTGTVTLNASNADGSTIQLPPNTSLLFPKSVTAVAGVASFTALQFPVLGLFQLTATTSSISGASVRSTPINVTGTLNVNDLQGLRQNIARDDTTWVGTTGYPTVTANPSISATDKLILDGDLNINASSKTVNGIRFVPPYFLYLTRVVVKYAVSSLTGVPYIRVLGSDDTTNGTDGTWTLITSHLITTTNIAIRQFEFSSPHFYKAIWVTLDKGSGAASMIWYSTQLYGTYNGSRLEIQDDHALEIANEGVLSIPYPSKRLNAAGTETRKFTIFNRSTSDLYVSCSITPARYNSDTGVNGLVDILDANGLPIGPIVRFPALTSVVLYLQWKATAAPTLDGEHYVRISLTTGAETTSYAIFCPNNGLGIQVTYIDSSVGSFSTGTGGRTFRAASIVPNSYFLPSTSVAIWKMASVDASATIEITGPLLGLQTVFTVADKTQYNRLLALSYAYAWISMNDTTTIYELPDTASTPATLESTWKTTYAKFTIPSQSTGPKTMRHGNIGRVWIANGLTTSVKIYEVDYYGSLITTIDTATDLAGETIETFCFEPANNEVYVITRNSGSGRYIARYNASTGAFIARVSNTDEGTVNCQGCFSMNGYLYVFYAVRYVNKYDLQTLGNRSRVYDWATGATATNNSSWEGRM